MKKFMLVMVAMLAFIACEGPMGPPGRDGLNGLDGEGVNWKVKTFLVKSTEWELTEDENGLNPYFICKKSYSELDDFVFNDGNVFGYLIENHNSKYPTQTPIESTIYVEDGYGQEWAEGVSFSFEPGYVYFKVYYSDFNVKYKPIEMKFRVVLNW